jgi:hypothetical protein
VDGGGHVSRRGLFDRDPSWAGRIAFILAVSIGVSLCAAIIIVALTPSPLDTAFGSVITTLAGAAVGAVATYLGTNGRPAAAEPAAAEPAEAEPDEAEPDGD